MSPLPWRHLLAAPLILMPRRGGTITAPQLHDMGLTVGAIADECLRQEWAGWFGIERGLSRTDIDAATQIFLKRNETVVDWYQCLLDDRVITIEWYDQQPMITPASIARWEELANYFDIDALLTLDLARKQLTGQLQHDLQGLRNWRTLPRASDHELRSIFARGLTDMHVHLGGVRIAPAVWCDMMEGVCDPNVFRELNEAWLADSMSGRDGTSPRSLAEDCDGARRQWQALMGVLAPSPTDARDVTPTMVSISSTGRERRSRETNWFWPRTHGAIEWSTWSSDRLAYERHTLIQAWNLALDRNFPHRLKLLQVLDAYLLIKHRFFRLARQPVFAGTPGLRHFDEHHFGRLRRAWRPWGGFRQQLYEPGPRRRMADVADACMYLMESRDLRKVELRIAPFRELPEYIRFFKSWTELEQYINDWAKRHDRTPAEFRFSIHFKRTSATVRKGHDPERSATTRILTELDRESAVLRLALATDNVEHRYAKTALARIDVAGQERDTPLSVFVVHMRLLRGDPEMLRVLDEMVKGEKHPCHEFLATWRLVKERGKERPSLAQPGVGMTVHAGEDYADVLDGLYQIGVAVDHLGLRAGDSIGHALALGAPLVGAQVPRKMAPLGVQHDSLCWLHDLLEQAYREESTDWNPGPLRDMIVRSGNRIYRQHRTLVAGARHDDFVWLWRHKLMPLHESLTYTSASRKELVEREYADEIMGRREQIRALDDDRIGLNPMIAVAQKILLQRIIDRRIVVEINPSSNIRISGARHVGDSPAVRLIQSTRDGLLVSINTDDPGVFASCIENEYALLLQGIIEDKVSQAEARALLERARIVGLDLLHWPTRADKTNATQASSREDPDAGL